MLPFYADLLENFVREDGLAILGEGLGLMKLAAGVSRQARRTRDACEGVHVGLRH